MRNNQKSARTGPETPTGGVRRPELLALATEMFAKQGYADAALRDLAIQAGVTAAAIYYHFAKKEDLLREIVFKAIDGLNEDVLTALTTAGSPLAALEAVIRAHLRFNVRFPLESKIIIEESRFLNETDYAVIREKQLSILNVYRACIRELVSAGVIGDINPTIAAFNVVSIIVGWYRWFRISGSVNEEDAFEQTMRFAMAAVLHAAPGGRQVP